MESPSKRGSSAIRPEIRAMRLLPEGTGGGSATLLWNWTPYLASVSLASSANSGPPGPLAPVCVCVGRWRCFQWNLMGEKGCKRWEGKAWGGGVERRMRCVSSDHGFVSQRHLGVAGCFSTKISFTKQMQTDVHLNAQKKMTKRTNSIEQLAFIRLHALIDDMYILQLDSAP